MGSIDCVSNSSVFIFPFVIEVIVVFGMDSWSLLISAMKASEILKAIDFLKRDCSSVLWYPQLLFQICHKRVFTADGPALGDAF